MLVLTSIRSEIATDEDLRDTSFKNEDNNDETNELEIKTEDITVNDHDENEIDIKINNIVDGADVNNSTGSEPAALPITSTECSQDIQIKNESSFEDTDTRTDILDIDIVKEELNISTDNKTDVIEDFNKEQDTLNLDISQVTSETTITVSKEIYQDFDDEKLPETGEKHKANEKTDSKKEPSSRLTCKHCNIAMTTKARLRLHQNKCQKSATTEIRFYCDICKLSFRKQISLKKHKEKSHVNKFSSKVIMSEAEKATSDMMKIELSDDDCVDVDNSSDMELLDEEYLTIKYALYDLTIGCL